MFSSAPATLPAPLRRRYRRHEWRRVRTGASGAGVWRLSGRTSLYVKLAGRDELTAEADRCAWLGRAGIGAPEVVDLDDDGERAWLVTTEVPGRPLSGEWPAHHRAPIVAALARFTRHLHDLPVADCPFDRRLSVTLPLARQRVEAGLVDAADFDAERRGRTAGELLPLLEEGAPEGEDAVICHGDLTLDNVLVDPVTLDWSGVVDVGRLGVADRHQDLALACRELAADADGRFGPPFVRAFLEHYGSHLVDPDRLDYYRLLDEFF
ncbi:aminoglycoside 3'-phosphotransferase [Marinactinospora endophytica]